MVKNNNISGWGNFPRIVGKISKASTREQLIENLNETTKSDNNNSVDTNEGIKRLKKNFKQKK